MQLLLNPQVTPVTPLVVTTEIDRDNDILIKYDGISIALISHVDATIHYYRVLSEDRANLVLKGVRFTNAEARRG